MTASSTSGSTVLSFGNQEFISVRQASLEDAAMVLSWRNSSVIRSVSLNSNPIPLNFHHSWFASTVEHSPPVFFILLLKGLPIGVIRIENLDADNRTASWGCYLARPHEPPHLGGIMPIIALIIGFELHELRSLTATVLSTNTAMLSVHSRMGLLPSLKAEILRSPTGAHQVLNRYEVDPHQFEIVLDKTLKMLPKVLREFVSDFRSAVIETKDRGASDTLSQ